MLRRFLTAIAAGMVGAGLVLGLRLVSRFALARRDHRVWMARRFPPLKFTGAVQNLTVVPLIDRTPSRPDLCGEEGVSYLVKAGGKNILFDVGYNIKDEHPSPLLRNMQTLGVSLDQVDSLVISHMHGDHVGGDRFQNSRTFSLSGQQVNLDGRQAFVPTQMVHPTAKVEVIDAPREIAPGVATIGSIPRPLFWFGQTMEQSLAVNVQDKGIVLIIGCGHPTLQSIIEQAEKLFDQPVYGVIGGLHYPVTDYPAIRFYGSNKWPWDPVSKQDVNSSINFLQQRHPGLVAISPHDSCGWTIDAFRQAFGSAYQDLEVGKSIIV